MDSFFFFIYVGRKMTFSYMWRAIQRQNFLFSQTPCQNYPLSHIVSLNHVVLKVEMCYPKAAARVTLFSARTKNLPVSTHHTVYLSKTLFFSFFSLLPSDIPFLLSFYAFFFSLSFSASFSPSLLSSHIQDARRKSKVMVMF